MWPIRVERRTVAQGATRPALIIVAKVYGEFTVFRLPNSESKQKRAHTKTATCRHKGAMNYRSKIPGLPSRARVEG